jgi:hypothetical protein
MIVFNKIKKFKQQVEYDWWKPIIDDVNNSWINGTEMFILGHGVKKVHLCVPFFIGDDPQLCKVSGIKAGRPNCGCRYCIYPTSNSKMKKYDKNIHTERNLDEIKRLSLELKRIRIENPNECERDLKKRRSDDQQILYNKLVNDESVNVEYNSPFWDLYMGFNNDILRGGTPADDFHTLCAGLFPSINSWILRIIILISEKCGDLKYKNISKKLLDHRIRNMPLGYETTMRHIPFVNFKQGLTFLVAGLSLFKIL